MFGEKCDRRALVLNRSVLKPGEDRQAVARRPFGFGVLLRTEPLDRDGALVFLSSIRAAQLGKKVACVEKERAGGTCLNWGCIPTKSLLRNAELYHILQKRSTDFGFKFDNLSFDWSKIISRSRSVADKLAGGVEFLFKKSKIDYLRGEASITGPGKIVYKTKENVEESIDSENILIATGAVSRDLPGLATNGKTVLNSHDAMIVDPQPKRLIVIGAGAIGG